MVQVTVSDIPFPQPRTLRIRFQKIGRLQYISHLDLMRTMTRVVLRCHIPVCYSEGFHPIPRLSFAAPLSVGVESISEILDIRITHPVDLAAVRKLLNENLPPELAVSDAYMAENKITEIAYTDYDVTLAAEKAKDMEKTVDAILHQTPLEVLKNTKAGEKMTDISSVIRRATVTSEVGKLHIRLSLSCPNASFLNPEYVITALKNALPEPFLPCDVYRILRVGMYRQDGSLFI